MNKSVRKVSIAVAVLFIVLFVNLNYVQVVRGSDYRDHPDNARVVLNEYSSPRGDITVNGAAIAHSVPSKDSFKYQRVYPNGALYAPVTGYYPNPLVPSIATSPFLGTSGIEAAENSVLSGDDPKLFTTRLTDLLTGRNPRGGSVDLSIDKATQVTAYKALMQGTSGPVRGAVVALDPTTGAVLAAVSTPSYDPNKLSTHNQGAASRAYDDYCRPRTVNGVGQCTNPVAPLLNRAFNQTYPPGSTFKVVVSAAAMSSAARPPIRPDTTLIAPQSYFPETGATKQAACTPHDPSCVENFDGEECNPGNTTATLAYGLAKSCNTMFSALAVDNGLGPQIGAEAKLFGFDSDTALQEPVPIGTSTVGSHKDLVTKGFLARTAFGQQDVRMTVLQGAMIAGAVANNGTLMQPYLVSQELAPNLDVVEKTEPNQLDQVLDPNLDHELQTMMEGVVTAPEGTGHAAAIPGVQVGGKTGTADTGLTLKDGTDEPPHSWFIGFAMEKGKPKIAVAVLIEHSGMVVQNHQIDPSGPQTETAAAPIAAQVMRAYLNGHGG
jgi:penicillin-binding protein A